MAKRILIVEDSAMMRKIIAKVIKEAGHEVVGEANDGMEAIKMYEECKPDMVTMDITMRGMDGLSAAKEILTKDSNARILILSNMNEDKYRDEVEAIGALGLVNKHNSKEILRFIEA